MTDKTDAVALADGNETATFAAPAAKAAQKAMLRASCDMAKAIVAAEGKVAGSAKEWGRNRLILTKVHKLDGDELVAADHTALDWDNLVGDAGKAIKSRYGLWLSKANTVSRKWRDISDSDKAALFAGEVSFLTIADRIVADRKAAEAAAKAEGKAAATEAKAEAAIEAAKPQTLKEMAEALCDRFAEADESERAEAAATFEALFDLYNSTIVEAEGEAQEPEAIAA